MTTDFEVAMRLTCFQMSMHINRYNRNTDEIIEDAAKIAAFIFEKARCEVIDIKTKR